MKLKGKVAIVTGASYGIGRATAEILSHEGARVALVARSTKVLQKLSRKLPHSIAVTADVTKKSDIERMVKKTVRDFGTIDILVNNAGQGYDAPIEHIRNDWFHKVFELDVVGPLLAMQEVIPVMRKHGGGAIVNISSGTALMYLPYMAAYSSLKGALAVISLTAREELKRDKITVSVVYPYITDTDFEKNTMKNNMEGAWEGGGGPPHPPDTAEYIAKKIVAGMKRGDAEIYAHDWMKNIKD